MNRAFLIGALLVLAMGATACAGGATGNMSSENASDADMEPIDELKAIPASLQARVDTLMQPINEVDPLIQEVSSLPGKIPVDQSLLDGVFSAQLNSDGAVEITAEITVDGEVKAEIEAVLERMRSVVSGLKAIPENTTALTTEAGEALVKVPALATEVATSAKATIANPFGSAEAKAAAEANLSAITDIQANVEAEIEAVQSKIGEIPARGNEALAKLTGALSASAGN